MSVIFRGDWSPKLQRKNITYSPTSGYIRTWDYKGFSERLMLNLMSQYTDLSCEAVLSGEHDVFTLQVRDSRGEVNIDTWQIQQADERPSSLTNPLHIANGMTENDLRVIGRAIKDGTSVSVAAAAIEAESGGTVTTPDLGEVGARTRAGRLYDRIIEGGTEFTRSIYVLRHTTNAPSNYEANIADWNVDCIYTVNQLLTEVEDESLWRLPLPPRLSYKIQNLDFPAVRANYQNGWLKRGSSESTAANFRIEICTEYWMGQISTDEYNLAV